MHIGQYINENQETWINGFINESKVVTSCHAF